MRVRFRAFWPGFVPGDFFVPLVEGIDPALRVEVVESGAVDLEFVSVFPSRGRRVAQGLAESLKRPRQGIVRALGDDLASPEPDPAASVSIWYSGENVRPPLAGWDLTLSFDRSSALSGNEYLPLWWLLFPDLLKPARAGGQALARYAALPSLDGALIARATDSGARKGFVCAVIGNPEPVRMGAIKALGQVGQVDVFGRLTGRPVPSKAEVLKEYRFTLCFENDVYPGYVSEKLIEAWACATVPLWNGLDPAGYINRSAMLNLAGMTNLDAFCESVALVNDDVDSVSRMASEPILSRRPSLSDVRSEIRKALVRGGLL